MLLLEVAWIITKTLAHGSLSFREEGAYFTKIVAVTIKFFRILDSVKQVSRNAL